VRTICRRPKHAPESTFFTVATHRISLFHRAIPSQLPPESPQQDPNLHEELEIVD
jgi:hypothetical protein